MRSRFAPIALTIVLGLTISGCTDSETIDVAAAQAQFCSDVEQYISAIGNYGGLFEDVDLTVGDVKNAADELAPGREAVEESAATFQEAVAADPTPGVTVEVIQPESIEAVKDAEAAFAAASDIDDNTTVVEAGVNFTSAAYGLEVAWVRLFADAGCIVDEAQAKQWVSDYVTALQTDLQAAGLYQGDVDGIYGPMTIAAVEQLQKDAGLPVTGLVDPATQAALALALGQRQSAEIGALQGILISTGYYDGPVDGIWSREVEDGLKALQTDLGVPATGVVDAATLRAFEQALNDAGEAPPTTTSTEPGRPAVTTTTPPNETTVPAETTTTAAAPTTTRPRPSGGILEVLAEAGQFTQLLAAIEAAGLTETLAGPGPFTLFAPTDDAFAQLAEPLPTDPEALSAIILHHVVEANLSGFDLEGMTSVTTAQGSDLAISVENGLIVLNGVSTVTVANVIASNGTAHVVNAVLLPPG